MIQDTVARTNTYKYASLYQSFRVSVYRICLKELSNYSSLSTKISAPPSSAQACTGACPAARSTEKNSIRETWMLQTLVLHHQVGISSTCRTSTGPSSCLLSRRGPAQALSLLQERSQHKIPFSWSPSLQEKFEAAKNPTATDRVPCEPQEIHRGLPCPAHRTGLVHGNAVLVPLCASRVLH